MNYQTALEFISKGRNGKERKYGTGRSTSLRIEGDKIIMRLHETDILIASPDGSMQLNTGGWRTVTTKQRLNNYWFLHGWYIYQERSIWYIKKEGIKYLFEDNLRILSDGSIEGAGSLDKSEDAVKLNRAINAYANDYVKALLDGNVPKPSNGDCWDCLMKDVNGNTLGDLNGSHDHIITHMKEKYYVPSLLVNALKQFPEISQVANYCIGVQWGQITGNDGIASFKDIAQRQISRVVKKYLKVRLGLAY